MKIAFFDFDGTLTRHDSFIQFALFAKGRYGLIKAMIKSLPELLKWKLGIISNSEAKEALFGSLFRGMKMDVFQEYGKKFASYIEGDLRVGMIQKLKYHQHQGDKVIIVSASIGDWIRPWATDNGIDEVLATEAEVDDDNILTGKFRTRNCHGQEKANRIKQLFPDIDHHETWAYGDSSGDDAMLSIVTHPLKVGKH